MWMNEALVPRAAAGTHPFQAGGRDQTFLACGVFVLRVSIELIRQRRDARMRVPPETCAWLHSAADMIEKHKRLDRFADITRAHHPANEAMLVTANPLHNLAWTNHCTNMSPPRAAG